MILDTLDVCTLDSLIARSWLLRNLLDVIVMDADCVVKHGYTSDKPKVIEDNPNAHK